jgi:hypothetical protein
MIDRFNLSYSISYLSCQAPNLAQKPSLRSFPDPQSFLHLRNFPGPRSFNVVGSVVGNEVEPLTISM